MLRILNSDKDTYITNKYVNSLQVKSGNVGIAGSLDLFKLYGITQITSGTTVTPQTELSRILLHFDLDPLRDLLSAGKIDITDSSFRCHLVLKDVYGGQPTPNNFTLNIFPLSASFDEGLGKDTAYYADQDKSNFLSASKNNSWLGEGCSLSCFSTGSGDYITSSTTIPHTLISQTFTTGEEDLFVDVTNLVSATLKYDLPDSGFRISYSDYIEADTHTYFVKRFGSRQSYDESKRPKLLVRFDDSISDDASNLYLDAASNLFLYNYVHGELQNLMSASFPVTGSNCLLLKLTTEVSGVGSYSLFFTGSQHKFGSNYTTGIYTAPVTIPLVDANIKLKLEQSGSVKLTPVWGSIDGTLGFVTGSIITAYAPDRSSKRLNPRRYTVSAISTSSEYTENEDVTIKVNIFDENNPIIVAKKLPVILPGVVLRNVYYAIRDASTEEYVVPFDSTFNSTKVSSDSSGMYFSFNTSVLIPLRNYVIDIMLAIDGSQQKYLNASSVFRIKKFV
jgi:hypothetical protein